MLIKIPKNLKIFFFKVKNIKYLNLITKDEQSFYIKLPSTFSIKKIKDFFLIEDLNNIINKKSLKNFIFYFLNYLNSLRIKTKKIILFKGLGLKFILEGFNKLILKLGFSHETSLIFKNNLFFLKSNKNYIKILSHYKIGLGNFIQHIFKFKPANSYTGRGLFIKGNSFILKPIKKT